ncbi:ornithine decarboxylase 1-like [Lutzomyia longipalpis]|uniref:ornithine decarboxylase 1-like n=1 Tax=Lutzomyia longipalpis TaxID=7200 RepID=UPI002483D629|nr:ornithine decarboxylase 1-like [Lutzomyia longipalpis]
MKLQLENSEISLFEGPFDAERIFREKLYELDGGQDEALFVCNLTDVAHKFVNWCTKMPRVRPFYAVKCNDDDNVIRLLARLGAGFDCASRAEINAVLKHGVTPDRIIFANPAKPASHIRHAAATNTRLMTFDSTVELEKIRQIYPDAQKSFRDSFSSSRLVLRIRYDAKKALCKLGEKFGCDPKVEAPRLLLHAKNLGLSVVGVSFHVGSTCMDPPAYGKAIAAARDVFNYADTIGTQMTLLDIGGGFPGNSGTDFGVFADIVNVALEEYFPDPSIRVIAEPGAYFVASACTIGVTVHSKTEILDEDGTIQQVKYYINDGIYGCFCDVAYGRDVGIPKILSQRQTSTEDSEIPENLLKCSIWGESCDGIDKICNNLLLPNINLGDILLFPNMGAYSIVLACNFNGFPIANVLHYADHETLKILNG